MNGRNRNRRQKKKEAKKRKKYGRNGSILFPYLTPLKGKLDPMTT
jgi:hypothetical protein